MPSAPPPPPSPKHDDALAQRIGGTAAGLLGGTVFGLVVAALLAVIGSEQMSPLIVFGGSAVGTIVGYLSVDTGLGALEGAVHLLIGLISGVGEHRPTNGETNNHWLRWLLGLGFVLGVAVLCALSLAIER